MIAFFGSLFFREKKENQNSTVNGRWTRTNDLWIMIPLFYQLNYSVDILTFTTSPTFCSTYGNKRGHLSNFERFGCFTFFLIKMVSFFIYVIAFIILKILDEKVILKNKRFFKILSHSKIFNFKKTI